ncbi:MAG: hypothetical protein ACRDBI_01670 [Shewanella sp.]
MFTFKDDFLDKWQSSTGLGKGGYGSDCCFGASLFNNSGFDTSGFNNSRFKNGRFKNSGGNTNGVNHNGCMGAGA